jgi:cytochrome P450
MLAPVRIATWRAALATEAARRAAELPTGEVVDLVHAFASPWSLALAAAAVGAPPNGIARLAELAREVFLAAACATAGATAGDAAAQEATMELARALPGADPSLAAQAFVALSQTLPCVLAAAWLALLRHPDALAALRADPALLPDAVEELLRHASPARAVFRRATTALSLGGARIAAGDSVTLMLSAANHDPARFPDPARLDLRRGATAHLAFGRGTHGCLGAPVVRMAVAAATDALLRATTDIALAGEVEPLGGFAIEGPGTLPVVLRRATPGSTYEVS